MSEPSDLLRTPAHSGTSEIRPDQQGKSASQLSNPKHLARQRNWDTCGQVKRYTTMHHHLQMCVRTHRFFLFLSFFAVSGGLQIFFSGLHQDFGRARILWSSDWIGSSWHPMTETQDFFTEENMRATACPRPSPASASGARRLPDHQTELNGFVGILWKILCVEHLDGRPQALRSGVSKTSPSAHSNFEPRPGRPWLKATHLVTAQVLQLCNKHKLFRHGGMRRRTAGRSPHAGWNGCKVCCRPPARLRSSGCSIQSSGWHGRSQVSFISEELGGELARLPNCSFPIQILIQLVNRTGC